MIFLDLSMNLDYTHLFLHVGLIRLLLPVPLNQGPLEVNYPQYQYTQPLVTNLQYQCTLLNQSLVNYPQYQYTQPLVTNLQYQCTLLNQPLVNSPQYQVINQPLEVIPHYVPPYQPVERNLLYHQFLLETLLVSDTTG